MPNSSRPDPWGEVEPNSTAPFRFRRVSDGGDDDDQRPLVHQGGWVRVDGGGLSQPISVRFAIRGGRPHLVGVLVDNGLPLTAELLRSVRIGALLEEFLGDYGSDGPKLEGVKFKYRDLVEAEWFEMTDFLARSSTSDAAGPTRAKRGQAPDRDSLKAFADAYRRHLNTTPRRAMTATAREMHMARSTAYRWVAMAKDAGLLDGKDTSE